MIIKKSLFERYVFWISLLGWEMKESKNNPFSDLNLEYFIESSGIFFTKYFEVSQVYESITFTRLLKMLPFTNIHHLERIIVSAVKEDDLQISIKHQTNSLSFGSTLQVALKEEVPDGPYIQVRL